VAQRLRDGGDLLGLQALRERNVKLDQQTACRRENVCRQEYAITATHASPKTRPAEPAQRETTTP
jgi:hypothetical protein